MSNTKHQITKIPATWESNPSSPGFVSVDPPEIDPAVLEQNRKEKAQDWERLVTASQSD